MKSLVPHVSKPRRNPDWSLGSLRNIENQSEFLLENQSEFPDQY